MKTKKNDKFEETPTLQEEVGNEEIPMPEYEGEEELDFENEYEEYPEEDDDEEYPEEDDDDDEEFEFKLSSTFSDIIIHYISYLTWKIMENYHVIKHQETDNNEYDLSLYEGLYKLIEEHDKAYEKYESYHRLEITSQYKLIPF